MNVLALDLSLTSTGWAVKHGTDRPTWGTFAPKATGVVRLAAFAAWLDTITTLYRPDLVVLEGYSFGSRNSRAHALGELGGVVRLRLHQRGIPFVELAPKVRAKLATGKGNAGKDEVLAAAIRRLAYDGHSNDEADARWLLEAALQAYLMPGAVKLPASHGFALLGVDWPQTPGSWRAVS